MTKNNSKLLTHNSQLLTLNLIILLSILTLGFKCNKSKKSESAEAEVDTLTTVDSLTLLIENKQTELLELDSIIKLKRDSLSQRETELITREQALDKASQKIDLTLKHSSAKLSKIYETMEPSKSASVMDSLPDENVVKLLLSMKERSSARILEVLPPDRAARITQKIMRVKNE
ncbi:hypothetical protein KAW50_01595 [candidate division WOR-3 bacterium]|nr:hypothetical protein [candidate division WOR-3 bacterium]